MYNECNRSCCCRCCQGPAGPCRAAGRAWFARSCGTAGRNRPSGSGGTERRDGAAGRSRPPGPGGTERRDGAAGRNRSARPGRTTRRNGRTGRSRTERRSRPSGPGGTERRNRPKGRYGPGEAGPRGEPGPIGPGIQPVYFNAVMQGGFQTVAPEDNVRFLLAFQSGDFSFTPNTSEITVNTEGIYRIDYTLLIRPAAGLENIAYAVAINGVENPLSFFGIYSDDAVNTERAELTGMFITSITAGSTVVLRNKSSSADYLAGTGIDNQAVNHAAILLQRIA